MEKDIVLVKFFYSLSMTFRNKISRNDLYEKGWQKKEREGSKYMSRVMRRTWDRKYVIQLNCKNRENSHESR